MILDVWGYYRTHFEWNQKLMKITVEIASSVIYLFFLAPRSVLLFPHMFLLYWCHHLKCNFTINLISRHAVWERKRKQITFTSLDRSPWNLEDAFMSPVCVITTSPPKKHTHTYTHFAHTSFGLISFQNGRLHSYALHQNRDGPFASLSLNLNPDTKTLARLLRLDYKNLFNP